MADLIDRQALIANLNRFAPEHYNALINNLITKEPAVDAVKVVRCKKCIHAQWSKKNKAYYCKRSWTMHKVRERDFCSYGARRKDDG